MRRPLWETLVELVEAVRPAPEAAEGITVRSVRMDLPIEVQVRQAADGPELLADLPSWRWSTVFDRQRGRLRLYYRQDGAP
jgi:hypothetical protein